MRPFHVTASGLWRAALCLGSGILEREDRANEDARHGQAGHAFLHDVNRLGRSAALERAPEEYREAFALIDTASLPVSPDGYAAEVAFAFDVVTGGAIELHRKGDRDYSMCGETQIPGTADVVALVGDDGVYVADWKFGWKDLPEPAVNWQFRFLALAAARAYGRTHARVEMIRVGKDGTPYRVPAALDAFDLAEVACDLRELHANGLRWAHAGGPPPVKTGAHCEGCASLKFCPASQALVSAPRPMTEAYVAGLGAITREREVEVVEFMRWFGAVYENVKQAVHDYALLHPIRMPDGSVYGPRSWRRTQPFGVEAWRYLAERFGEEVAWKACEISSTWTKVEGLVRKQAEASGEKYTHAVRRVRAELEQQGAVKVNEGSSVGLIPPPRQTKNGRRIEGGEP